MYAACGPYIRAWKASPMTTPRISSGIDGVSSDEEEHRHPDGRPDAAIAYSSRRLIRSDSAPASGIRNSWQAEPMSTAVSTWLRVMPSTWVA